MKNLVIGYVLFVLIFDLLIEYFFYQNLALMKLIFTLILFCFSFHSYSQSSAQATFPEGTDFHRVTDDYTHVSFDLLEDLPAQNLTIANNWVEANASIIALSVDGNHVEVAIKSGTAGEHAWGKLFAILGLVVFEVPTPEGMKVVSTEQLFQHFGI